MRNVWRIFWRTFYWTVLLRLPLEGMPETDAQWEMWKLNRRERRKHRSRFLVLGLLEDLELSGAEISERTGLGTGELYPLLLRLETEGLITSHFDGPKTLSPRRRLYRVCERRSSPAYDSGFLKPS